MLSTFFYWQKNYFYKCSCPILYPNRAKCFILYGVVYRWRLSRNFSPVTLLSDWAIIEGRKRDRERESWQNWYGLRWRKRQEKRNGKEGERHIDWKKQSERDRKRESAGRKNKWCGRRWAVAGLLLLLHYHIRICRALMHSLLPSVPLPFLSPAKPSACTHTHTHKINNTQTAA